MLLCYCIYCLPNCTNVRLLCVMLDQRRCNKIDRKIKEHQFYTRYVLIVDANFDQGSA